MSSLQAKSPWPQHPHNQDFSATIHLDITELQPPSRPKKGRLDALVLLRIGFG